MSKNAQIIQITMTALNAPLRIDCGLPLRAVIGTQGDHNAQELEFVRPREFAAYDLHLSLRDRRGVEHKWNIRKGNKFLITSELTRTTEVSLQIAFQRGVDFRRGTNELIFSYRPRKGGKLPPPEPIPNPVADLIARAAVDGRYDSESGKLIFDNTAGNKAFEINLPSGGGGGDIPIASETVAGKIKVGDNLNIDAGGRLSVVTTNDAEGDNTRPITSAGVHTQLGNVEALLAAL